MWQKSKYLIPIILSVFLFSSLTPVKAESASITLNPSSGHYGTQFDIIGTGFPGGAAVDVLWDDGFVSWFFVESDGSFTVTVNIPFYGMQPFQYSLGSHIITVKTEYEPYISASATFTITPWPCSITISPSYGLQESWFDASGSGFPPNNQIGWYWDDTYQGILCWSDPNGDVSGGGYVPSDATEGYHEVRVEAYGIPEGQADVSAYFWVGTSPPTMTISPCDSEGTEKGVFDLNEDVYVKGSGFPPSISMDIYIIPDGASFTPDNAKAKASLTTDDLGNLAVTFVWTADEMNSYDVWVDVNQNGIHDNSDVVNYIAMSTYSFFVIPESPLGALLSLASMLAGLLVFYKKKLKTS
jgi:hypothetical protein